MASKMYHIRIVVYVLISCLNTSLFAAEAVEWQHVPSEIQRMVMKSMVVPIAQQAVDTSEFYETGFLVGERSQIESLYRLTLTDREHKSLRKDCGKIVAGSMKENFKRGSQAIGKALIDKPFDEGYTSLMDFEKKQFFHEYSLPCQSHLIKMLFNHYFLQMSSKIMNSCPQTLKKQLSNRYLHSMPKIDKPVFSLKNTLRDEAYGLCLQFLIDGKKYRSLKILRSKNYPFFFWHIELLKKQLKNATYQNETRIRLILSGEDVFVGPQLDFDNMIGNGY